MAQEQKYGEVITELGNIGKQEPVFLFRAQDRFTGPVLEYYESLCKVYGSSPEHLEAIRKARREIEDWQSVNGCKLPGELREPE